ncbi:MAG: bifunctional [glutamine synthetase] adenylyltransferase/[glutamine synthetase]-adenylyl-L-tyrosine phosphorylase, partial [Alphaproteobacteria bacterium]
MCPPTPIDPDRLPAAADADRAALGRARWQESAAACGDPDLQRFAIDLLKDTSGQRLLDSVFGNSPFLTHCLLQDIGRLRIILSEGFEHSFCAGLATVEGLGLRAPDMAALMAQLRHARSQVALTVALADISGVWDLEGVTRRLSRFADCVLRATTGFLLREAHRKGDLTLPYPDEPNLGSGLIILAMGKLGANELNYSSDIDLIVLYDAELVETERPDRLQQVFVRMARGLVKVLDERTADGYVFRTDLRLRPDPGATPLAISVQAAETYYESIGQNWERAAMIKARPAAGDLEAGHNFLETLRPFVWRRSLDFAAIQDIHSIKRQIHAHKGGSTVALEGHNIKLGRGGIREVEFFVQTQQLIWGGRSPGLRTPATLDSLRGLAEAGRIDANVAARMAAAYRELRRVEHRLQMINDEQTQTLPSDQEGIGRLATFLGYGDGESFGSVLLGYLRTVEHHYAELFEEAETLGSKGSLVFTGSEHDPDTLKTLAEMGFGGVNAASTTVRGWQHGRYRATRSTRSRQILTELMPGLLSALAATANPDKALSRFDAFLKGLPAGVQLFSLFHSNPSLLTLVAEIMGGSPALASWLSHNPLLLDGVLDESFFSHLRDKATMAGELEDQLVQARDMQDVLDLSRRWANDAKFQVGVQILRQIADIDAAGQALSDIADSVIEALLPRITTEFAERHGHCPGRGLAVVALGKLGSRELTATSDLDLVLLYDLPDSNAISDGDKPLPAQVYYQRLGQRLITALTAMTGEGKLYEVDMRLRPSGNKGPLAVSLEGFEQYQLKSAWTWEHQALTRARVVFGEPRMRAQIAAIIRDVLCQQRDNDELLVAVDDMRTRMAREHG